ncbi:MAG: N-6 DNA methylase [Anaerolineae bacterium]
MPTFQKLRGGYYTPRPIAEFLARWAITTANARVLEPSCGDGVFLRAAAFTLLTLGAAPEDVAGLLHAVEIDVKEAAKAIESLAALGIPVETHHIHVGDFFSHCERHMLRPGALSTYHSVLHSFDAVIGNPPFIRYQNFPDESRVTAFRLMRCAGLHPNKLTNSWVPFLVVSTLLLSPNGRLAMVIPAELFQVNYAAEVRQFLSAHFCRITILTFRRLLFESVQQEVVLLLCERNGSDGTGIRVVELDGVEDLASYEHTELSAMPLKPMDHSTEKWTQYYLDPEEILLLRRLKADPRLTLSGELVDVDVGVVTGLNEFFVLREQEVRDMSLSSYTSPIVTRSAHLQGTIFRESDWYKVVSEQHPCFLLRAPDAPFEALPSPVKQYVAKGLQKGVQKGYKCRIRKHWYATPSVWVPDAFMLRQVHSYPKLILNEVGATSTDTVHRVKFLNGICKELVTAAFVNSLTFAFAEVTGRSYGGGVLTFEPSESERLPIPLVGADKLDINRVDQLLRANQLEGALDESDRVLLGEGLGLTAEEIAMVRGIWYRLRDRRINRK